MDIKAFYNRAMLSLKAGDYQGTIEGCNQLLEIAPNSTDAYILRGRARSGLGEFEGAFEDWRQSLTINPNIAEAHYNLASLYLAKGVDNLALEHYSQAIAINPNLIEAYYQRGKTLLRLNQYRKAVDDYQTVIRLQPAFSEAYIQLSKAYSYLGQFKKALKELEDNPIFIIKDTKYYLARANIREEIKDYQGAIEDYNKVLQINSESEIAYIKRGFIRQFHIKDDRGSMEDYNRAISINPENAWAYFLRGLVRGWNFRDWIGQIEDYNQALLLNPKFAEVYANRGLAHFFLDQYGKAIEDYNKAIGMKAFAAYYLVRSIIYDKLGKYQQVIEDCKKVIAFDPSCGIAYFFRGDAHEKLGYKRKAIEDYDRSINNSSSNYKIKKLTKSDFVHHFFVGATIKSFQEIKPYLFCICGLSRYSLQLYQEAIKDFTQAIDFYPIYTRSTENNYKSTLGELSILRNYCSALEPPGLSEFYTYRGLAYLRAGNIQKSFKDCQEALSINPNSGYVYRIRGTIYYQQKNLQAAIWNFQQAAKYFFDQEKIDEYDLTIDMIRELEPPPELLEEQSKVRNLDEIEKQMQALESRVESLFLVNHSKNLDILGLFNNFQYQLSALQQEQQYQSIKLTQLEQEFSYIQQLVLDLKATDFNYRDWQSKFQTLASRVETAINNIPNLVDRSVEIQVTEINELLKKIQPYEYRLVVNRDGGRAELLKGLQQAEEQLIIVCPWLHYGIQWNNKEVIRYFRKFLEKKNSKIDIGWGNYRDIESVREKPGAIRDKLKNCSNMYSGLNELEKLERDYPDRFNLKLLGTHEKFFVGDRKFAMLGSHNFLTSSDKSAEREVGVWTTDPRIIEGLIAQFHIGKNLEA